MAPAINWVAGQHWVVKVQTLPRFLCHTELLQGCPHATWGSRWLSLICGRLCRIYLTRPFDLSLNGTTKRAMKNRPTHDSPEIRVNRL